MSSSVERSVRAGNAAAQRGRPGAVAELRQSGSVEAKVRTRPRVAGQRTRARGIPATPQADSPKARRSIFGGSDGPQPAGSSEDSPKAPGTTTHGRRRWLLPVTALVAALAVLATLVGVTLRDPGAQQAAERAAASQARTSVEQMLSYDYKTIDKQAAQIETLLTGSFKDEFSTAMESDIKPLAVKNHTVVRARVSDVGVMSATPTTVRVLAFVNQAKVGAGQEQPTIDQNRVIATMTRVGDRWLVSKVDAF